MIEKSVRKHVCYLLAQNKSSPFDTLYTFLNLKLSNTYTVYSILNG